MLTSVVEVMVVVNTVHLPLQMITITVRGSVYFYFTTTTTTITIHIPILSLGLHLHMYESEQELLWSHDLPCNQQWGKKRQHSPPQTGSSCVLSPNWHSTPETSEWMSGETCNRDLGKRGGREGMGKERGWGAKKGEVKGKERRGDG